MDPAKTTPAAGSRWIVTKGGSWFEGETETHFLTHRPGMGIKTDTDLVSAGDRDVT